MKNPVGPILRMGDEVEQVIAAIEDDNPATEIEVIDRGSYVRVQGEDRVVLTQDTLREYLGHDFEIRSLGAMMSSFAGRVITTSDSIVWERISARREATAGEGVPA
ncbi:MmoB/DmpM family protein [Amycolatopsis sp. MEPSY49]|uniref:MmoB/DmpM family protein n=1 Tax=Amycolatopsis sp. MEPSY49 TaxID=3151600 RepID=UPI003EF6C099